MSGGMTMQRDKLHSVHYCVGVNKRAPFAGLDVRRCNGLRALKERWHILRRLSGDFRRQPKVAFCLRDVDLGIWKDAISVLSREPADVVGVEVSDQNKVDFFRCVACSAKVPHQVPERSSTKPSAGARID